MKLATFLFLFLSSVTLSSARADPDTLGGSWSGTYFTPSSENVIDLQFDQTDGVYRGHYTPSGTSFPVSEAGQAIRFVVPNVGIFQGRLHGDVLEGNFIGAGGTGPFRINRGSEPDFSQFVD